ncbi:unnamed protein product [Allacma fusca]|uniref:Uncharacterized protein n=1 Tax=Allacma fusca TaxID=39272 RepID=A0A8J2LAJ0_9HEXA|nr:unnamed protein product [Allacma fusca]
MRTYKYALIEHCGPIPYNCMIICTYLMRAGNPFDNLQVAFEPELFLSTDHSSLETWARIHLKQILFFRNCRIRKKLPIMALKTEQLLQLILAIFLPPLAVFLVKGAGKDLVINIPTRNASKILMGQIKAKKV